MDAAIPASGPQMSAVVPANAATFPFDIIDLNPEVAAAIGQNAGGARAPGRRPPRGAPPTITLAAGDIVRVRVFEPYDGSIYAPMQRGGTEIGQLRIAENGTISVPYAGAVQVAGLGLQAAEQRIIAQLTGRAYQPQVVVELVTDNSNTFTISGEVKRPGRASVMSGAKTVLDAIARADGTTKSPYQHDVILTRQGVEYRLPIADLLTNGDIPLQRGDKLLVVNSMKAFTALGAVRKSGNVEINRPVMTLLEALGDVGGLSDERANKTGVYVFRPQDSAAFTKTLDRPVIYRLDFSKPMAVFAAQHFTMQPRDILYVSNSPLYEMSKLMLIVNQIFALFTPYAIIQ